VGIEAVLFDFDGVIADSERLHLAGFRLALDAHDISLTEADYFARYLGFDDRDGFRAILADNDRDVSDALLKELMQKKADAFRKLVAERVDVFAGVRELLEELRDGPRPLPLAIGSGALSSEIRLILQVTGLGPFFDAIVGADDVARSKPDPETYRRACALLAVANPRVAISQCLVIEDSPAGLVAGGNAGAKTLAVANSYAREELEPLADRVVSSMGEVDRALCESLFD
jgi:HAD superfamily hydrolase (TIGR01509 family)